MTLDKVALTINNKTCHVNGMLHKKLNIIVIIFIGITKIIIIIIYECLPFPSSS